MPFFQKKVNHYFPNVLHFSVRADIRAVVTFLSMIQCFFTVIRQIMQELRL